MVLAAIDLSEKEAFNLVTFINGIGTFRFTDFDSNVTIEGQVFTSLPTMEIKIPENVGTLNEGPCEIKLPQSVQFAMDYTSGQPYPETAVICKEVIRSFDPTKATAINTMFRGTLAIGLRNADGKPGLIKLSALSTKARMKAIALGEPANHHCSNRLGDAMCKFPLTFPTYTLSAINGTEVTMTGVPTLFPDRWYQKGYLLFQGLPILIQDWRNELNGDRSKFFMMRRPPTSWIGQVITAVTGCDKTVETCRARFNNEANIRPLGYAMPAYHPVFEQG